MNLTDKEIFYKCAKHLLQQATRCIDDNGNCCYKNRYGEKAPGALFLNDEEIKNIGDSIYDDHLIITQFEIVHDSEDIENWPNKIKDLAKIFDIEWTEEMNEWIEDFDIMRTAIRISFR